MSIPNLMGFTSPPPPSPSTYFVMWTNTWHISITYLVLGWLRMGNHMSGPEVKGFSKCQTLELHRKSWWGAHVLEVIQFCRRLILFELPIHLKALFSLAEYGRKSGCGPGYCLQPLTTPRTISCWHLLSTLPGWHLFYEGSLCLPIAMYSCLPVTRKCKPGSSILDLFLHCFTWGWLLVFQI